MLNGMPEGQWRLLDADDLDRLWRPHATEKST